MTFQYRSLLPIIKILVERGDEVTVFLRGYFSERHIRNQPRAFLDVTPASLRFVATQCGLDTSFVSKIHFFPAVQRLHFPPRRYYRRFDLLLATTKGFPWLNELSDVGRLRIAVPYQNFLHAYYAISSSQCFPSSALPDGEFEEKLLAGSLGVSHVAVGLPYLDSYYQAAQRRKPVDAVLLLHPGGYRNIFTRQGASREESYSKQIAVYRTLLDCLPPGLDLTIKLHPLAARYHDRQAHEVLAKQVNINYTDQWYGEVFCNYRAILSFGSSALFETLPFNRQFWILTFCGTERTRLYEHLGSFMVHTPERLREILATDVSPKITIESEARFVDKLTSLADGNAVQRALEVIDRLAGNAGF